MKINEIDSILAHIDEVATTFIPLIHAQVVVGYMNSQSIIHLYDTILHQQDQSRFHAVSSEYKNAIEDFRLTCLKSGNALIKIELFDVIIP